MPEDGLLRDFVIESNAIEGYLLQDYSWEHPLFSQHFAVLMNTLNDAGFEQHFRHPHDIHKQLMAGLLDPKYVGCVRTSGVQVGNHIAPPAFIAKELIELWTDAAMLGQDAEWFHKAFEYIHPYVDGNGRTGRILWAMMRAIAGEPFEIVARFVSRQSYYRSLQGFEKEYTVPKLRSELMERV